MTEVSRKIRLVMELRKSGITNTEVLSALERVPREMFVLPSFLDQAYENTALPIDQGQTISQPFVVAFMTQALELGPRARVLEIGTGSGYQAAVLSQLCRRVYTVERFRSLLRQAESSFKTLGLHNVVTRHGDGRLGWPEQAPFDRIIITAAATEIPPAIIDQLSDDGILVLPIGQNPWEQSIVKVTKSGGRLETQDLLPVRFVPLVEGVVREPQSSIRSGEIAH